MFDFLKRGPGRPPTPPTAAPGGDASRPLGLHLGAVVKIDPWPFHTLADHLLLALPQTAQTIEARGVVDLGEGMVLQRYYFSDDYFLQLGVQDGRVLQVRLFQFFATDTPASTQELQRWLQPGSPMGTPTYALGGVEFARCWGDPDAAHAPPVVFDETVYETDGAPAYDLTHYAMLYERELPGAHSVESLLISAEDSGPNDYCIVTSVGLDLSPSDLEIVR